MTNAFIDTNILLHFKVFEGIKWDKFLGDKNYTFQFSYSQFENKNKDRIPIFYSQNESILIFKEDFYMVFNKFVADYKE